MLLQDRLDDLTLYADAAAVDDSDLAKPALYGLEYVLFHHNLNFPRLKSVKVDGVFDWKLVHWRCRRYSSYSRYSI